MKNDIIKSITRNAVVAAIYFALTFAVPALSYGYIQFRFAEALVLLCFFRKDYTIGLTIGCLLCNVFSTVSPWDIIFGTLATAISCLAISFSKHLLIATLYPVIANGLIVGALIAVVDEINFFMCAGFVALGELVCITIIGYLLFFFLRKNKYFMRVIGANQNLEFKW